jgi:hypothetical protein
MPFFSNEYKSSIVNRISQESTGKNIKMMISIILVLVVLSFFILFAYNGFNFTEIFSNFNVSLLSSANCLTIVGLVLAMIYGFHYVSKDPSSFIKYLPGQNEFLSTDKAGSMTSVLPGPYPPAGPYQSANMHGPYPTAPAQYPAYGPPSVSRIGQ